MIILDRDSNYTARPIVLNDYMWLCETLEDFPLGGGFSMVRCQNELSSMRRLIRTEKGMALLTEHNGDPVSITTMVQPSETNNSAVITIQSTHPDHRGQGHGNWTSLVRGYYAFHIKEWSILYYDTENVNMPASGLIRRWENVSQKLPEMKSGKFEPERLYKRNGFSAQNWLEYLDAHNIDVTRFSIA